MEINKTYSRTETQYISFFFKFESKAAIYSCSLIEKKMV